MWDAVPCIQAQSRALPDAAGPHRPQHEARTGGSPMRQAAMSAESVVSEARHVEAGGSQPRKPSRHPAPGAGSASSPAPTPFGAWAASNRTRRSLARKADWMTSAPRAVCLAAGRSPPPHRRLQSSRPAGEGLAAAAAENDAWCPASVTRAGAATATGLGAGRHGQSGGGPRHAGPPPTHRREPHSHAAARTTRPPTRGAPRQAGLLQLSQRGRQQTDDARPQVAG
mmetsp:Transcript_19002/g.54498  ORF Transcript_19002/g.54498 Transcript_19002/m.54498 type:complete len:226 (-) Transcript_19002:126-803(-)